MTSIGFATLQIIPSFKGVSKAIEKEVSGKSVRVPVEPSVDTRKSDKAGKQAGEAVAAGLITHIGKAGTTSGDAFGKTFSPRVQSAGRTALSGLANLMVGSAQGIGGQVGGGIGGGLVSALANSAAEAIDTLDSIGTRGGGAMSSKLTSAGVIAAGGVALVGTAAVAATAKLYEIGAAWDDVTDGITARTGLIGSELEKVTNSVKNVAMQTAAAPGDIASVTSQLVQTLKLSGADLENLTKQISDYNEMNQGASLNVREFSKAMKQYGITSAGEMAGILDRLNNVAQNTGIPLNSLISTLRSAGPVAQQFRLPLADVTQLLSTFEDAGLNATSATSLLKLALGNLAKADPTADPVQALQNVVTKIQELDKSGQTLAAVDLAKSTFGRSWDQILPLIQENRLEIDNLNTATAKLGPTINEQRKATEDFSDEWRKFKNFLEVELLPGATFVFGGINDILSGLTRNIRQYLDLLRGGSGRVTTDGFPGGAPQEPISLGGGPGAQRERRGYGSGGYTGSMSANSIAGVVHGGEYVINARSTAGIEKSMPGLLGYLNNLPGYKGGGKVQLGNISGPGITTKEQQSMWDAVRGNFPNAILSSATRTVMTEGRPDYHNAGRAIDISGPGMGAIASWIASNYPDSLELIHSPFSRNIKNGKSVGDGMSFYGAGLMAAHRDHVHWALGKTASAVTATTEPSMSGNDMLAALGAPTASAESVSPSTVSTTFSNSPATMQMSGSLSGLAGMGLDQLGKGVGTTAKGSSDLSVFGNAANAAVTGQVSSALGVLGVNDSPGWLKGASMLLNSASISDSAGSAAPLSAGTSAMSAAGSALNAVQTGTSTTPASVTNFNIQTTDLEPAYLISQRQSKERAAAEMSRY